MHLYTGPLNRSKVVPRRDESDGASEREKRDAELDRDLDAQMASEGCPNVGEGD
jgi:hypothetical protein